MTRSRTGRTPSLFNMLLTCVVCLAVLASTNRTGHARPVAGSGCEKAHPFVQTIADVFVNRTRMTIRISSSADELDLIHGIVPYDDGKYDTSELLEGINIHGDFLLERFEIYDPAGNKLVGKVVERPNWEIPAEGLISGRLVDYMLDYVFEYKLEEPPEYLTFQNNIIDYNFTLPSEVKLVVKQAGSSAPYAANLKIKQPETVRFDWDKPLLRELSGDELREWFNETREKTLGITTYGGVYSFIYVTPREIRHEVLMPLANVREFIKLKQADEWYLEIEEQEQAIPQIEKLFSELNLKENDNITVKIDGELVTPNFDRFDFAGLDVRDFGKNLERKRVSLANGRVGVIMSYPIRNLPETLEVSWNKFSKMLKDVDVILIGPDDKVQKFQFSRFLENNTIKWENPGIPPLPDVVDVEVDQKYQTTKTMLPVATLICGGLLIAGSLLLLFNLISFRKFVFPALALTIGAVIGFPNRTPVTLPKFLSPSTQVADQDAGIVFTKLHTNLFRAFDYHSEEAVYDALAQTTDGPLLKKIYLDMRKSLEVKEQGGAVSNIDRIEIMEGEITEDSADAQETDGAGFTYRCVWELEGTVEHWGHIHRRTNKYEALFNVQSIDGLWKFTGFQPVNEEQGPVIRSLRKF